MTPEQLIIRCIRMRDFVAPPTASLRKLMEESHTSDYIKLCYKAIVDNGLVDNDTVYRIPEDPLGIRLDAKGIKACYCVLKDYIDESLLNDAQAELLRLQYVFDNINEQISLLRKMSYGTLKVISEGYSGITGQGTETQSRLQILATEELKARKLHKRIMRKFSKLCNHIKVLWRYRRLYFLVLFCPGILKDVNPKSS